MGKLMLGIDLACRAEHRASLADEAGKLLWQSRAFHSTRAELDALADSIGPNDGLTVVLEPTRNAWVPVAAYFMARGAKVVVVPPEQAADLRRYYSKHAKSDKLDSKLLARLPLLHPDGLVALGDLGPARAQARSEKASPPRRRPHRKPQPDRRPAGVVQPRVWFRTVRCAGCVFVVSRSPPATATASPAQAVVRAR